MAKFNEATRNKILGAVIAGTGVVRAARAADVNHSTFWRWLQQGQQDLAEGRKTNHAKFFEAISKAQAEVVGKVEKNIVAASALDWRAGSWWLAKRVPAEYAEPKTDEEREEMKRQASAELLSFVRDRVPPDMYQTLLQVLAGYGESNTKRLPCPA